MGASAQLPTDDPSVLRQEVEPAEREAARERELRGVGALGPGAPGRDGGYT